jgi:hypothetical protein
MTARIIFIFLVAATAMRAGDWYDQLWPETNVYVTTSQHSRLFLLAASTRTRQEGYSDGQLGAHMDFYFAPIFDARAERHPDIAHHKFLMVRAGYLYGRTPKDSSDPFTEHTALIEMTPRYYLPKQILISDRNRGDMESYGERMDCLGATLTGRRAYRSRGNQPVSSDHKGALPATASRAVRWALLAVVVPTPSRCPIRRHERPAARSSTTSSRRKIAFGLPIG